MAKCVREKCDPPAEDDREVLQFQTATAYNFHVQGLNLP